MAPLPDNTTATYFVDYQFGGQEHTMQFRYTDVVTLPAVIAQVNEFLAALAPIMSSDWEIVGARFRATGSNVSLPTEPPVEPAPGGGVLDPSQNPRFVSFIGRGGISGRRVRLYVYGLTFVTPDDYRLDAAPGNPVGDARLVLDSNPEGIFVTVAGDNPLWYPYANVGYNSYWEREQRG